MLHRLSLDLEALYADTALAPEAKRERKMQLIASLPERVAAAPLHEPARYAKAAADGGWNNARLAQFRTYNSNRPAFAAVLARANGDLVAFIERVRALAQGGDPFAALEHAAAAP